jgi:hypothetical protein
MIDVREWLGGCAWPPNAAAHRDDFVNWPIFWFINSLLWRSFSRAEILNEMANLEKTRASRLVGMEVDRGVPPRGG